VSLDYWLLALLGGVGLVACLLACAARIHDAHRAAAAIAQARASAILEYGAWLSMGACASAIVVAAVGATSLAVERATAEWDDTPSPAG
jgi:hypothetical protein